MEGSAAENHGAPDSWEVADLDGSMRKLLVSPAGPSPELLEAAAAPSTSAASSSPPAPSAGGRIPEEVLSQVDQFLREALEKPRERLSILRMEQDIQKFIRDPTQQQLEFQSLPTSYLRLAAHRLAQHYYLQSVVVPDNSSLDGSGSRIVLHKTSDCRFPLVRLADIPVNLPQDENNAVVKVAIKQRPQKWSQTINNLNTHSSKTNHPKSVEERKEEYNKARARIFSSNPREGSMASTEVQATLPETFQHRAFVPPRQEVKSVFFPASQEEKSVVEESLGRDFGGSSGSSNRLTRNITEHEPAVSRYRVSNRVAIFRDREVDRKDPDYDRSYDRYMQRFDPGFGFNSGPYPIQPMYAPAVTYNTEFPHLGCVPRPQISADYPPRHISQHMPGHWLAASATTAIGYGHPDPMMMAPFSPSYGGGHALSSIYMHPSQYQVPRPGMSFIHPREQVQPSAQTHHQQLDASYGLARPR